MLWKTFLFYEDLSVILRTERTGLLSFADKVKILPHRVCKTTNVYFDKGITEKIQK